MKNKKIFDFAKFGSKSEEFLKLFLEILQKRAPEIRLNELEHGIFEISKPLSDQIRDQFLADELCETGIDDNGEINERGIMIDDLISFFGFWNWDK